jgi:hypothetical protein
VTAERLRAKLRRWMSDDHSPEFPLLDYGDFARAVELLDSGDPPSMVRAKLSRENFVSRELRDADHTGQLLLALGKQRGGLYSRDYDGPIFD